MLRINRVLSTLFLFLVCISFTFVSDAHTRYRGQYTFSHEVNVFCPIINSQCYWLSSDTQGDERRQLKQLTNDNNIPNYESVCVVVEGLINRDPMAKKLIGFAEPYDGLFAVSKVFGLCDKTRIVTQGELQHHRWVLASVNDENVDVQTLNNTVPELDFGEKMHLSGNTGCNQFNARAVLRNEILSLQAMVSTRKFCAPAQNTLETLLMRMFSEGPKITITKTRKLILETENNRLVFELKDWLH